MNEAKKDQYFSNARVPKKSVKTKWHKVCFWSERTQQKKEPPTFNYPACDQDERVPMPDRRKRANRVRTYNPNRRLHEHNPNPNLYGRQGRVATATNRTLPNTPVSSRRSSARNSPADNYSPATPAQSQNASLQNSVSTSSAEKRFRAFHAAHLQNQPLTRKQELIQFLESSPLPFRGFDEDDTIKHLEQFAKDKTEELELIRQEQVESTHSPAILTYEHIHPYHSPSVEHHNSLRPVNKQLFPAKKKKTPFKRSPVKTRSKTVAKPAPSQGYRTKRKFITEKRPNP